MFSVEARMSFSMAPLLLHSPDIPARVRDALRAASASTPERRGPHLVTAARLIYEELAVECADARELVGLPPGGC